MHRSNQCSSLDFGFVIAIVVTLLLSLLQLHALEIYFIVASP